MLRLQIVRRVEHLFLMAVILTAAALFVQACSDGAGPTAPTPATGNAAGATAGSDNALQLEGPHIDIEKATNGLDADQPTGPQIPVGDPVTWTYVVTNTGNTRLRDITVTDDVLGAITCPATELVAGASMTCTATGVAEAGQYSNVGTVTGTEPEGPTVTDSDPSHYFGSAEGGPAIDIEKATNGFDADQPTGPQIPVGDPVTWTYVVTNTGNTRLRDITVTDDVLGAITCPATVLVAGASMTCTATGVAEAGQYSNVGTVTGTEPEGPTVTDSDPSHYFGSAAGEPAIDIEKATNGFDADLPTGPQIPVGDLVTWTYVVTNTGNTRLRDITVTDDVLGAITCPATVLVAGASMTCTATGFATAGQYSNVGTVTGTEPEGPTVTDRDPSHYFGMVEEPGYLGCSHGYWKNHLGSWAATGYSPGQTVGSVFVGTTAFPSVAASTLQEALSFGGGPTVEDAARNLLRQAVGSLLNAAHPDVPFPRTVSEVISAVDAALATGNRQVILSLKGDLDTDNNLGCPLN